MLAFCFVLKQIKCFVAGQIASDSPSYKALNAAYTLAQASLSFPARLHTLNPCDCTYSSGTMLFKSCHFPHTNNQEPLVYRSSSFGGASVILRWSFVKTGFYRRSTESTEQLQRFSKLARSMIDWPYTLSDTS